MKYTKEFLQPLCEGKTSIAQVCTILKLKGNGSENTRRLIKEILIENKTYLGQGHNRNKIWFVKTNKQFFQNNGIKRSTYSVREALFERGIKEKSCECCGQSVWMNNPIPLEVHHKDGNKYNNELSNLEILCPNCHYFTDTYKTKNIQRVVG